MRARALPKNWCFITCRWYQTWSKKYNFVLSTVTTHTHTHKDPTCFSKKEIILEIFLAFFLKFFDFFFWKFRKTTFSGILKCLCGGDAEAKPPHGSSTRTRARAPALLREYGRTLFWTRSRSSRSRRWMYYFFASERRFTWVYMFFYIFRAKNVKNVKNVKIISYLLNDFHVYLFLHFLHLKRISGPPLTKRSYKIQIKF